MSKAEDLAKELFPLLETDKIGNNPYISYNAEQLAKQEGFVEGYHQAEKDFELTWEDLATIEKLCDDFIKHSLKPISDEEFYKEVLKRFKEHNKL